jgi:hypothetical protein
LSTIAFLSLVNDRAQFEACQASLRAIARPFPEWLMVEPNRHGWNAAQGLNHGIEQLDAEWIVTVHQDVLFPADFWTRLQAALEQLPPHVALAGIVGCEGSGRFRGHIVCARTVIEANGIPEPPPALRSRSPVGVAEAESRAGDCSGIPSASIVARAPDQRLGLGGGARWRSAAGRGRRVTPRRAGRARRAGRRRS